MLVRTCFRSASQPPNNTVFYHVTLRTHGMGLVLHVTDSAIATTLRHPTAKHLIYDLFSYSVVVFFCFYCVVK